MARRQLICLIWGTRWRSSLELAPPPLALAFSGQSRVHPGLSMSSCPSFSSSLLLSPWASSTNPSISLSSLFASPFFQHFLKRVFKPALTVDFFWGFCCLPYFFHDCHHCKFMKVPASRNFAAESQSKLEKHQPDPASPSAFLITLLAVQLSSFINLDYFWINLLSTF